MPCGDRKDTITSSRRDTSENTTLTAASVTTAAALRALRSVELQTKKDECERIVMFEHVVVRCTTARLEPKFEPSTLILLKRCVAALNINGARKLMPESHVALLRRAVDKTVKFRPTPLEIRLNIRVSLCQ